MQYKKCIFCMHSQDCRKMMMYLPTYFFKKKLGQSRPLFLFIFVLFSLQIQYKLKKALMVCLGFEPWAAGW